MRIFMAAKIVFFDVQMCKYVNVQIVRIET